MIALFIGASFMAKEVSNKANDNSTIATVEVEDMAYAKSLENRSDVADQDAYADYLEVLSAPSPKEENDVTSVVLETRTSQNDTENKETRSKVVEPLDKPQGESPSKIDPAKEGIEVVEKPIAIATVDHTEFGKLLQKHVDKNGNVNYKAFINDRAKLDAYIQKLSNNPVTKDQGKNERLAYYINVYNAHTIALILDNYPVSSIQDINGGKPWDKLVVKLGNTSYSLNDIENNIIRTRFAEPRIHFAVNCAAASCPPLLNDAYYPATLMSQLDERTRSFISNSSYNTITSSKLQVSKIFDWYGKDFKDVKSYLVPYTSVNISDLKLEFKEYDWSLNKQ